jgi:hypothetical protein
MPQERSPNKPGHRQRLTRVRTGCLPCRLRKKKCDVTTLAIDFLGARSHTDLSRRRSHDVQDVYATDSLANGRRCQIRDSPQRTWRQTKDQTALPHPRQLRLKAQSVFRWPGRRLQPRLLYHTAFELFRSTQIQRHCCRGSYIKPPPL